MTERERLIELLQSVPVDCTDCRGVGTIADYLLENGVIVPPVKVGDTIYEVFKYHKPPFIKQTKVEKIIITEKGLKLKLARNSVYETSIASLGKTLFLTEAKALKKLKEVEQTI